MLSFEIPLQVLLISSHFPYFYHIRNKRNPENYHILLIKPFHRITIHHLFKTESFYRCLKISHTIDTTKDVQVWTKSKVDKNIQMYSKRNIWPLI